MPICEWRCVTNLWRASGQSRVLTKDCMANRTTPAASIQPSSPDEEEKDETHYVNRLGVSAADTKLFYTWLTCVLDTSLIFGLNQQIKNKTKCRYILWWFIHPFIPFANDKQHRYKTMTHTPLSFTLAELNDRTQPPFIYANQSMRNKK